MLNIKRIMKTKGLLVTLFLAVLLFAPAVTAQTQTTITVNANKTVDINKLEAGIYIGSADTGEFKNDVSFRNLAKDANVKIVAFMENRLWAVPHPCTRFPDRWNWAGIDTLIRRIYEIGAEPLIVLGFWYTSGVWTVDGYKLPTAYEWGSYCTQWVKHFKDVGLPVKYYDIGHETHQYTNSLSKLHYVIDLYIEAEKQMRAVNPNILLATDNNMDVGNSWQVANIQQEYLDKGATFDFLMWHRYVTGRKSTPTSTLIFRSEYDEGGVMGPENWIEPARQNYYKERGEWLPVIAAGNLNWAYSGGTDTRLRDIVGGVCMALNFKLLMLKGADFNIVYTFGGSGSSSFGIVNTNTHEQYYPYHVYKMLGPNLAKGDSIVESTQLPNVASIAWLHGEELNVLLIHKTATTETITINGIATPLSHSKIDGDNANIQTGTLSSTETITLNGYTVMLLSTQMEEPEPEPEPEPPVEWTLEIQSSEEGTTNPDSGTYKFEEGTNVEVIAVAYEGFQFDQWLLDGAPNTDNPITFVMNKNHVLAIYFSEIPSPPQYWNLNIASADGGATSASGTMEVLDGSDVSVTANADLEWEFSHWLFDGENVGNANPITIPAQDADTSHTLVAVFAELPSTHVMHVESIAMSKSGRRNVRCRAVVTIVDSNGNPVAGATVEGIWSGLANREQPKVTGTDGKVTFYSYRIRRRWRRSTVTFTVDDVVKTGWTYDPQANEETSDSIVI